MGDLSIVIVTFNSEKAVGHCLDEIGRHRIDSVIVVDNGSSDTTLDIVRQRGVSHISLGQNTGFAAAANTGAKAAASPYLCFLNPDCLPEGNVLEDGLRRLKSSGRSCVVPHLTDRGGTVVKGRQPGYTRLKLFTDMIELNMAEGFLSRFLRKRPGYHARDWYWPLGTCLFVGRQFFLDLGGFDAGYFMYMEDVDLGRRVKDAGGEVILLDSRVRHAGGGSTAVSPGARNRLLNSSRLRYAGRQYGPLFGLLLAPFALPGLLHRTGARRD